MNKSNLIKVVCMLVLLAVSGANAQAQDWKSILKGVANAVANKEGLTTFNLTGTWKYIKPDCKFESDNLLSKAGGEVAAKKIEDKMTEVLNKMGFTEDCVYVFNADSTYTSTAKGRTTKGTYSYNSETKELTMKTRLGLKFNATIHQGLAKNKMSLLFKADKLMTLMQVIGGKLGSKSSNSTIGAATSLLNEYDGLQVGFELEKQAEETANP